MHFLPLNLILVCNSGKIKNSRFSCWPFTRTFWSNSRKPLRGLRAQESGKWIKKTIWWVSSGWFVPVIIFFNEYKFRPQRLELPFASIFRVTARWATCPGPRRRPPTSPSPWSSCSSSPTPPSWSSSSWGRGSYQSLGKSCWVTMIIVLILTIFTGVPSPGVRFSTPLPESLLWWTLVWIPTFFSFSTPTTERLHT